MTHAAGDPPRTEPVTIDSDDFRRVLGHYPTGVCVVTGLEEDGQPGGLTIGSFTSVSLDPPLVAFLPDKRSNSWRRLREQGRFCVNVLAADQEDICRAFASKTQEKFAAVTWRPGPSGSPILAGVTGWIDCKIDAVHDAGDHVIVIGRVLDLGTGDGGLPLLFFQGGYGRFSPHSMATDREGFEAQLRQVDRVRPEMERLAEKVDGQVVAAHCDGTELTLLARAGSSHVDRISSALIGQRLPVVAPIGIWWMAYADPDTVDRWLDGVQPHALRERYHQALEAIREHGYCLGQANVHDAVETMIAGRAAAGFGPTDAERQRMAALPVDPLDYVPPGDDADRPLDNLLSIWAPVLPGSGPVTLGVMLTAGADGGRRSHAYAEQLQQLARQIAIGP